jgi:ribosome-associated translation inhibitor RaiA
MDLPGDIMQILVNSNHTLHIHENTSASLTSSIEDSLHRFSDRVTRVEVHLEDVNAGKAGDKDKRCMLEARLAGMQPIAVTHQAESIQLALDGATEKLEHALDHALGKLSPQRARREAIAAKTDPDSVEST